MESRLIKQAIAVYDPPDNSWERAIQEASKQVTGEWLPAYPCRLLAKAVVSLKCDDSWLDDEKLMDIRAFYLFSPQMTSNKSELVFTTHLLYLRDILENQQINAELHAPITFVTLPLAHFLFRDCPVHIHINNDFLRAANKKIDFLDVGGMLISDKSTVDLGGSIINIRYKGNPSKESSVQKVVNDVKKHSGMSFKKAAVELQPDIFGVEEHYYATAPEDIVWDKQKRCKGTVIEVEPSETGFVKLRYENGEEISINKEEFHKQFVVI